MTEEVSFSAPPRTDSDVSPPSWSSLRRPLNKAYQEVLRSVFLSSSSSPSGANKKKSMRELQEEITNLYNNIRLFEKGAKFFSGKFPQAAPPRGPQVETRPRDVNPLVLLSPHR